MSVVYTVYNDDSVMILVTDRKLNKKDAVSCSLY